MIKGIAVIKKKNLLRVLAHMYVKMYYFIS